MLTKTNVVRAKCSINVNPLTRLISFQHHCLNIINADWENEPISNRQSNVLPLLLLTYIFCPTSLARFSGLSAPIYLATQPDYWIAALKWLYWVGESAQNTQRHNSMWEGSQIGIPAIVLHCDYHSVSCTRQDYCMVHNCSPFYGFRWSTSECQTLFVWFHGS